MFSLSDSKNIQNYYNMETEELLQFPDSYCLYGLPIGSTHVPTFLMHNNETSCLLRLTETQIMKSVNCSGHYGFKEEDDSSDTD
jgi:hypothetical protein